MILLVIKVLMMLLPTVMEAIRDGRIKSANQTEVLAALSTKLQERVERAIRAGEGPLPNEADDPANRSRTSAGKLPDHGSDPRR